jgi:hypothetical protein
VRNILVFALLFAAGAGASSPKTLRVERDDRSPRTGGRAFAKGGRAYAFLELFPDTGAGAGAACAGTNPTGAKGEAINFTRATVGTCLKGNATTGIVDGDLVKLTSGQPAVMPGGDGSGGLGILSEPSRTNDALRSEELCNAYWTNSATCTSDTTVAPDGTTTMETLSDSSGAASQGASRSITTSTATKHAWSCFVKAGTAAIATVSMTGAGDSAGDCSATVSGLSSTTATRAYCVSPAAYTGSLTAVTVSVVVGSATSDTGTIKVWGCQHEDTATTGVTSYIPTVASAVTRDFTVIDLPAAIATPSAFSVAATLVSPDNLYSAGGTATPVVLGSGTLGSTTAPSTYVWFYSAVAGGRLAVDTSGVVSAGTATYDPFASAFSSRVVRVSMSHTGSLINACQEGVCAAGSASTLGTPTFTRLILGRWSGTVTNHFNGVIKRICVDTTATGCL